VSERVHIGWFEDEQRLLEAVAICRERGIAVEDVVSPYPIHGLDDALGIPRTRLPWLTLLGGLSGLTLGLWLEYWTSASDWPIDVGGKPFDSFPAFVPVAFELTILGAGLCTVFGLLALTRRRRRSLRTSASDARIALVIARRDAAHPEQEIDGVLRESGALEVTAEEVTP
jgi:hypothetical protein